MANKITEIIKSYANSKDVTLTKVKQDLKSIHSGLEWTYPWDLVRILLYDIINSVEWDEKNKNNNAIKQKQIENSD